MKQGIKKRIKRIKAKGEATGKDAKKLAKKRASTYKALRKLNPSERQTAKNNAKAMKKVHKKRGAGKTSVKAEAKRIDKNRKLTAQTPSKRSNLTGKELEKRQKMYPKGRYPDVKPKSKNVLNIKPKKAVSQSDRAASIFDEIRRGAGL